MQRYDVGVASPAAPRFVAWPTAPRYPRPAASSPGAQAVAPAATPTVSDAPAARYGVRWEP